MKRGHLSAIRATSSGFGWPSIVRLAKLWGFISEIVGTQPLTPSPLRYNSSLPQNDRCITMESSWRIYEVLWINPCFPGLTFMFWHQISKRSKLAKAISFLNASAVLVCPIHVRYIMDYWVAYDTAVAAFLSGDFGSKCKTIICSGRNCRTENRVEVMDIFVECFH